MRPIARKILQKIDEKGIDFYEVLEILENTSTSEMKRNFPDDCHFQTDKYFARLILDSLLKSGLILKEGNRYFKKEKKKETEQP